MWIKESLEGTSKVLCLQQGPKEGFLLRFSRHRESRLSLEQVPVARGGVSGDTGITNPFGMLRDNTSESNLFPRQTLFKPTGCFGGPLE